MSSFLSSSSSSSKPIKQKIRLPKDNPWSNPWCDLRPQNELEARALRRLNHIAQKGRKTAGVSDDCGPHRGPPSWYDPVKFQHVQRLYRTYGAIINLSQLYGLLFAVNIYEGLAPLLATGNSQTLSRLYTRYLSTIIHVDTWFRHDPFDASSSSYRSLKIVRGLHRQVANQLNTKSGVHLTIDDQWISQQSMCNAQFAFVGFMTVFPRELGFHCFTKYDFHAMFHFWRVIGYCHGIEDQYNLCSGSDDEIVQMCRLIFDKLWLPFIVDPNAEPIGVDMSRAIVIALSRINPSLKYNVLMNYFMRHALHLNHRSSSASSVASLPSTGSSSLHNVSNIPSLNRISDYTTYYILYYVFTNLSRYSLFCWLLTCVLRIRLWLTIVWHKANERYLQRHHGDVRLEIDERCPFSVSVNNVNAITFQLH